MTLFNFCKSFLFGYSIAASVFWLVEAPYLVQALVLLATGNVLWNYLSGAESSSFFPKNN